MSTISLTDASALDKLVERMQTHDPAAVAEFMFTFGPPLRRAMLRAGASVEEAEALAVNGAIHVADNIHSYTPQQGPVAAWALEKALGEGLGRSQRTVSLPSLAALQPAAAPTLEEASRHVQAEPSIPTHLDPRLQYLLALQQEFAEAEPYFGASMDEATVAVAAHVTDWKRWRGLAVVSEGQLIALLREHEPTEYIVTGRVPLSRISVVAEDPCVRRLELGRPVSPTLTKTLSEIRAPATSATPGAADGGAGVVIGVIDFGCDFAHECFIIRNPETGADAAGDQPTSPGADARKKETRIEAIWDQRAPAGPGSPGGYGRVYGRDQINAALSHGKPYASLHYEPAPDAPFRRGAHGTHVMDIASGCGPQPGVAPAADLVFVELAPSDVPTAVPEAVGNCLGDSVRLVEAVRYVFDRAESRPCVVNLSLGTNGGPHDGSTLVERALDAMVREAPNRAIVLAAGNCYADGIHAAGFVAEGEHVDLQWRVKHGDRTPNELEIWYPGEDALEVEILDPNGTSVLRVAPGVNRSLVEAGRRALFVAHWQHPNNQDHTIGVFMHPDLGGGIWTVRIHGERVRDGRFHAWIERDDGGQSSFVEPHDNSHTLGSISCGEVSIVVGAYNAHQDDSPACGFSSAGPTRNGRRKPEISAPGYNVWAAHSRTERGLIGKSGTSMAAPAVTGVIALMFAEALQRGISLEIDDLRAMLMRTARRNPPAGGDWDPQYGFGRLDAQACVDEVRRIAAGSSPAGPASPPAAPSDAPAPDDSTVRDSAQAPDSLSGPETQDGA